MQKFGLVIIENLAKKVRNSVFYFNAASDNAVSSVILAQPVRMFFFNRSTLQCDDILTNQLAENTFVIGSQDANLSVRCKKLVGRHLIYAGGQLCFSGLQRQLYFFYKSTRIILSLPCKMPFY